jgi:hypothetical protein
LRTETGVSLLDIKAHLLCFILSNTFLFIKKMIGIFSTIVFYCTLSLSSYRVKADSCDTFNHPKYGIGKCINQKQCPNALYLPNLCESKPFNIKCCFSLNAPVLEEFRAVWIATVGDMDWPSSKTASPARQQQELVEILNTIERLNMNVVIFHVIRKNRCFFFDRQQKMFFLL